MEEILILGLIFLVGFIAQALFKYTKVPESLFMIIIGLVLGPFFGIVNPSEFASYTPLVVTLTLILVLLDSGLSLSILGLTRRLGKAIVFTLIVLVCSTFLVGGVLYILGWELLPAFLIGIVSSGTTTIVVNSLIGKLNIPEDIKQILVLESIINDVTLVTGAVLVIQLMQLGTLDTTRVILTVLQPILISILLGIVFAILWVNVVWWSYKGEELLYCFTLGMLFLLYFFVDFIHGNGAIAVLVLSLTLGNFPVICDKIGNSRFTKEYPTTIKILADRSRKVVTEIRKTQINFAFFVKIFFFVYLGIIFDTSQLNPLSVSLCALILLLMFVSRFVSTRIIGLWDSNFKKYSMIISSMVARGFTATFIALLPATMGIDIPYFKEIILLIVLFSTFPTIVGAIVFGRKK